MKILIVEDETITASYLRRGLTEEGYSVEVARCAELADEAVHMQEFGLILLDVMLPGRNGFELCSEWRAQGLKAPILILSGRQSVVDRVFGLDSGADDYLVKPFDVDELKARIRALLRRSFSRAQPVLDHREVSLDPVTQQVSYRGQPVALQRKEFLLLHELLAQPGRVLTRDRLQQVLYGWDEEAESNALEVHIHHLRKKLFPELIRTVRGVGYLVDKA